MGFWGQGALVAWHDMESGAEPNHDDWHSHEHLAERLAVPGFRRGRRCRSVDGSPEFLIMYEVDSLAVLTSPAYLERLNAPTDWTQQIVPTIRNMTRTLCRVLATSGGGVGAFVLSIRFRGGEEHRETLIQGVRGHVEGVVSRAGIVAAHLLEGDAAASGVSTDEMRMRGGADQVADLALMIEGYSLDALREVSAEYQESLLASGATDLQAALHQLAHVVTEADFASDSNSA